VKYLNNVVEQDHRRIERLTRLGRSFGGFWSAQRALAGFEAMGLMTKGQVRYIARGHIRAQAVFIAALFQITA
jgi:IS6 family transposase